MNISSDSFLFDSSELETGCHSYIDGIGTSFGYVPSLAAGVVFLVLFGLSLLIHTIQSIYMRSWWYLVFSVGCLTEVLGWAARTWASQCPYNNTAFLMQISTLIIAPTFFTAGIYVILGRFIQILGAKYSVLSARNYLIIFCTCDFISLVVQAIGGGMASGATNTKPGTNIMVAGISFQLVTITIFCVLFVIFLRRCRNVELPRSVKKLTIATVISVAFIYIRSIYRLVELAEGWTGYLITHEPYFIALDGATMVCAVGIYNIFHPAITLKDTPNMETSDKTFDNKTTPNNRYSNNVENGVELVVAPHPEA